MKKILKTISAGLAALALVILPALVITAAPAHAQINEKVCEGLQSTGVEGCEEDENNGFGNIAKRVINIFSIVVGAVSVIMIIIGGFRYIISGGDSGGVSGAKNTILYAIVGLVIVLFAQIIVRFVLSNATSEG